MSPAYRVVGENDTPFKALARDLKWIEAKHTADCREFGKTLERYQREAGDLRLQIDGLVGINGDLQRENVALMDALSEARANAVRFRDGMKELRGKLRDQEIAVTNMQHPPIGSFGETAAQFEDRLRREIIEKVSDFWERALPEGMLPPRDVVLQALEEAA